MMTNDEKRLSGCNGPPGAGPDALRRLPKRFYKTAKIRAEGGGFVVCLDGRSIETPLKNLLVLPAEPLAAKIAEEWRNQERHIDSQSMPLTKLANTAVDHVAGNVEPLVDDIVRFAASDLLCYRAGEPEALVLAQNEQWNPILAWCADFLGARLALAEGIVHVSQPKAALNAIRATAAKHGPFQLTAFHTITTLTGSALLTLALGEGRLSPEDVWRAAHVDEDFQISKWGRDAEAGARREKRWMELSMSHRFAALAGTE